MFFSFFTPLYSRKALFDTMGDENRKEGEMLENREMIQLIKKLI